MPAESWRMMNCTPALHRLQTPSKRITGCLDESANEPFLPPPATGCEHGGSQSGDHQTRWLRHRTADDCRINSDAFGEAREGLVGFARRTGRHSQPCSGIIATKVGCELDEVANADLAI